MGRDRHDFRGRWHPVIISGHDVGHWVAAQIGGFYNEASSQAIGLERDGEIVAGVIYESWNGKSITCHIAIERRISAEFLHVTTNYAFVTCGAYKVIAPVESNNHRSVRFVLSIGFVEEGRILNGCPGGDIMFFTLTADRCKYLQERYGKTRHTAAYA